MSDYKRLEKACGGFINPESLEEFEMAMREYKRFMGGMREMFGEPANERSREKEFGA